MQLTEKNLRGQEFVSRIWVARFIERTLFSLPDNINQIPSLSSFYTCG